MSWCLQLSPIIFIQQIMNLAVICLVDVVHDMVPVVTFVYCKAFPSLSISISMGESSRAVSHGEEHHCFSPDGLAERLHMML